MKLIFLDIDGVLNGHDFFAKRHKQSEAGIISLNIIPTTVPTIFDTDEKTRKSFNLFTSMLDSEKITMLNEFIKETNSAVVISSSWRELFNVDELSELLKYKGFTGKVIGRTPSLDSGIRGHEIHSWLERFKRDDNTVEGFIILDDNTDMDKVEKHFVHIGSDNGIEQTHMDLAITLLKSQL